MHQFRLFRGKSGRFFAENTTTKKQFSLRTCNKTEADRPLTARNEAHRELIVCLQMARAYLTAADPAMGKRTWQFVMDEIGQSKRDRRSSAGTPPARIAPSTPSSTSVR